MVLLPRLARLAFVCWTALAPSMAAHPRGVRGVFPRRVREAGRDEALYRRLKLREIVRTGKVNLGSQSSLTC